MYVLGGGRYYRKIQGNRGEGNSEERKVKRERGNGREGIGKRGKEMAMKRRRKRKTV